MKTIREFMDSNEAIMARDSLQAQGIQAEVQGAKDYSTIVVGGTQGRYWLSVNEEDQAKAEELLNKSNLKVAETIEHPTNLPEVALKKSVMWAFIAVVLLPLVGNYVSTREAFKYMRAERNSGKKWVWLILISWLQVPGIFIAWLLFKAVFLPAPILELSP